MTALPPPALRDAVKGNPDPHDAVLKLIASAYTSGLGQGMRDCTTSRGGDSWVDVRDKYEAALVPRLTALIAAAKAEGAAEERKACAALIEAVQETYTESGGSTVRSVTPRKHHNLSGLGYAAAIRSRTTPGSGA